MLVEPSPPAAADDILQYLRLQGLPIETMTPVPQGVAAQNFHATLRTGASLHVRLDSRRPLEAVRADRLFSQAAAATGVQVPGGPWLDRHFHGKALVTRPRLPGVTLAELDRAQWPAPVLLGRTLAQVHTAAAPSGPRAFFYAALLDRAQAFWSDAPHAADAFVQEATLRPLLAEALRRLADLAAWLPDLGGSPVSVVHGDYTPANLLLAGETLYVIDWEKACVAPSCSDIAQFIYYASADAPEASVSFALDFLRGYGSTAGESLLAWLAVHPAMIFMVDAVAAAKNRNRPAHLRDDRRERYFSTIAAQRFRRFLEVEDQVLSAVADVFRPRSLSRRHPR